MNKLQNVDPLEWQSLFSDWSYMQVRVDMIQGEDFDVISLANWSKLVSMYGGAPQIPVFLYHVIGADGTKIF